MYWSMMVSVILIYIPITNISTLMKKGQWVSIVFLFHTLFYIFFVPPAMSTTIIAFRTSNELILASDSLGKYLETGLISSVCKITQVKNVFVTFAGRISSVGTVKFNMVDIAHDTFSGPGTFQEKIVLFNTKIMTNLELLVNNDRKNKANFNKLYNTKNRDITDVIIAVVTDSYPTFYAIRYIIMSSAEQPAQIKELDLKCISPIKPGYHEHIVCGESEAIIKDLQNLPYSTPLPKSFNVIKNI